MFWLALTSTIIGATPAVPLSLGESGNRIATLTPVAPTWKLTLSADSAAAPAATREIPSLGSALVFTIGGAMLALTGLGGVAAGAIVIAYAPSANTYSGEDQQKAAGGIIVGAAGVLFLAGVPLLYLGLKKFSQRTEIVTGGVTLDPSGRFPMVRLAFRI
jgi:hypothetical protein